MSGSSPAPQPRFWNVTRSARGSIWEKDSRRLLRIARTFSCYRDTLPLPPPKRAVVTPLAPERYKVQITISREGHDRLRRAQDLLRHVIPSGDPAAIVERALSLLVADVERKKLASVKSSRPAGTTVSGSRHVPAAVKRAVSARDDRS